MPKLLTSKKTLRPRAPPTRNFDLLSAAVAFRGSVDGQKSRDLVGSDQPGAAAAGHWTAHWLLHIRVHQEFLLLRSIADVDLVSFKRELGGTSFSG